MLCSRVFLLCLGLAWGLVQAGEDDGEELDIAETGLPKLKYQRAGLDAGVNKLRLETGILPDSPSGIESSHYLHGDFGLRWKPDTHWELRAGPRVDAFWQTGAVAFEKASLDYGENYLAYRTDDFRLTFGTQKVIWGRVDELPPSDRLSRVDLTRFILDDLSNRRRAQLALRLEGFQRAGLKADLLWVPVFRAAELPEWDSFWHPVDRRNGRILGIAQTPLLASLVRAGRFAEDDSGGGGGGMRLSYAGDPFDFAFTLQRARQSLPYYRINPRLRANLLQGLPLEAAVAALDAATFTAIHPYSWVAGGDFEFQKGSATWRFEATYATDNPVTTHDLRYTTVPGLDWVAGVEYFPKVLDVRINLQVYSHKVFPYTPVFDRATLYGLNGEGEYEFANSRWRANLRFYFGMDRNDVYVNPKLSYLGFEPMQLYLSGHLFDGDEKTLGGFHKRNNSLFLGWEVRY